MSTFRAYLISPPNGPREYDTVKDRAKSRARSLGGIAEEVQLPATKAGLVPFLNDLERFHGGFTPAAPEPAPEAPAPLAPRAVPVPPPAHMSVSGVAEWVMDSASQAEVEQLFAALGVRFGELARARRVA